MANCPECDGTIELTDDLEAGEILVCPDCGMELEVMSVDPLELEPVPEVEEDWGE
jgi:alpha-aminoadipate carrier protein LysW